MAKKAFVYDGTNWIDIAQSTTDLSNYANLTTTPISGFRNAIINGGFDVWQRGTSFTANSIYTADRWWFAPYGTSVAATIARLTSGLPDGFRYGLSMKAPSTTAANDNLFQPLETSAVIPLRNKNVTFSFYYKIPVNFTSPLSVSAMWSTATDTMLNPGTGTFITSPSIANTASWTRFQTTFTVPATASSLTIGISGYNNVVQNAELQITGVQLEEGTIATPFEQRPIGTELALCQRYFQIYIDPPLRGAASGSTSANRVGMVLPVPLRVTPTSYAFSGTFNFFDGSGVTSYSSISAAYLKNTHVEFDFITSAGLTLGRAVCLYQSGNGTMSLSAEL